MKMKRSISTHVRRGRYRRYANIPEGTNVRLEFYSPGYRVYVTLAETGQEWWFVISLREKYHYIGD